MKRISIRIDDSIHLKLIDLANQEGLSLSDTVRNYLENQTSNINPTHQPEKPTEKQTPNKESLVEQLKRLTNTT